jgi:hypothetical protein
MSLRIVSVKDVLKDIRSGMDDAALRKKHNLSPKGLENLYRRLLETGHLKPDLIKPPPRKVNIAAVLVDVEAGMSSPDLMKKYGLSEEMIQRVSKKLLAVRGKRTASEGPETLIEEPFNLLATVEFLRHEVDFELPIYDAQRPEICGMVRDLSEMGISVEGIEAEEGDSKTLVILGDEFGAFSSFEFEGVCRWSVGNETDGTSLTGFAISRISETDLQELRNLIRVVTVGG